nr:glycosyltransferase [uncultured Sphaerochaeta sp.]
MSNSLAILLTLIVLSIDLFLLIATLVVRLARNAQNRKDRVLEDQLLEQLESETLQLTIFKTRALLRLFNKLSPALCFSEMVENQFYDHLTSTNYVQNICKRLQGRSVLGRIEAAAKLRNLAKDPQIRETMLDALRKETNQVVILYLFQGLARRGEKKAMGIMLTKLHRSTFWMAGRYRSLLLGYKSQLLPYLLKRLDRKSPSMRLLICEYALLYSTEVLKEYLASQAQTSNKQVRITALRALCRHFPKRLLVSEFQKPHYQDTLPFVIKAYANLQDKRLIHEMLGYANHTRLHDHLVQGLTEMSERDPSLISLLLTRFEKHRSVPQRKILAKVLDNRLSYILESKEGPLTPQLSDLISSLVDQLHISGLIQYLNTTRDNEKQEAILALVKQRARKQKKLRELLITYLDADILEKMQLKASSAKGPVAVPHQETPQRMMLILLLSATLLIIPLLILATELPNLVDLTAREIFDLYVVRFNYLLVYYSVTINIIYLAVLTVSFRAANVQNRLWRAKDGQMLFQKGLLPSVSIIAPAYNEASNIIESTNSLLNQQYPDYELIVVNDGSKDATLKTLIDYYNLEKQDKMVSRRLSTRPLRGIYMNKSLPNLIVVDKVNGGKADSLNLGLNVSTKEFFCGIDADSLLEPDALLKAVSVMLDTPIESIATGGNICPVNGCTVELGALDNVRLPDNFLARLQSLEYIRSFMTGRVGWASMNLLLIISGAFGIFHRERTIATGGYLTKSGKFHKDTVGEDMELVVRLSRYMREKHKPYRVQYACNANCWTEVPEKWKVLRRQRNRWHRGLIDIMLFHSSMIGNPRYGRLGMVGMLYYFIFELLGPFVEAQGLLFVILGAVLGLLNLPIALMLFTATIGLGIMVSLSAVFISEYDRPLYSGRDISRLLAMAVVENFGVRQVISLLRVSAYFSAMRKNRGWGAQVRVGFKASTSQTKTK